MTEKGLNALASAIYLSRMTLAGNTITEDDQRIRASGLYPDWAAGAHTVGEIFNTWAGVHAEGSEWDQTWEVYQEYDNGTFPDIAPGNAAWYTFNRPLHGKSPETARPFVPVQGAHDMYRAGEYMVWTDGLTYRCKIDTSFSPADSADDWEVVQTTSAQALDAAGGNTVSILDGMTVNELKEYAANNDIDLGGATKKAAIRAAIEAAEAGKAEVQG